MQSLERTLADDDDGLGIKPSARALIIHHTPSEKKGPRSALLLKRTGLNCGQDTDNLPIISQACKQ
jgi:hypothetical protein